MMLRHEWRQKVDKHRGPTKAERNHEYYGRRSFNRHWSPEPGRFTKTLTHRIERRRARDVIRRELQMEGAA